MCIGQAWAYTGREASYIVEFRGGGGGLHRRRLSNFNYLHILANVNLILRGGLDKIFPF
jgi:hypothetical protein